MCVRVSMVFVCLCVSESVYVCMHVYACAWVCLSACVLACVCVPLCSYVNRHAGRSYVGCKTFVQVSGVQEPKAVASPYTV